MLECYETPLRGGAGGARRRRTRSSASRYLRQMELRDLPSVDELARELRRPARGRRGAAQCSNARARQIRAGDDPGDLQESLRDELAAARRPRLRRVLNATGVIVHTNLGRAPLADGGARAGRRGRRAATRTSSTTSTPARAARARRTSTELLRRLTGAEAALVVNNNAAAVMLALAALAEGREVLVSRGELIEIGDGFRIPDVLARSGARLVEVGTTNRTRAADYEARDRPRDGAAPARAPVELPRRRLHRAAARSQSSPTSLARHGLPLVDDLGLRRARRRRRRADGARRASRPAPTSSASRATSCSAGRRRGSSSAARSSSSGCAAIRSSARCAPTS